MTEDSEYDIISAEIEKAVTRLTNDTRTCICTLNSLTITRDSFALSILGLQEAYKKVRKLAADELEWTAKHVINPPSDYPEGLEGFLMAKGYLIEDPGPDPESEEEK